MFFLMEKETYGPFWMEFNRLKARMKTTLRRQFTFYH